MLRWGEVSGGVRTRPRTAVAVGIIVATVSVAAGRLSFVSRCGALLSPHPFLTHTCSYNLMALVALSDAHLGSPASRGSTTCLFSVHSKQLFGILRLGVDYIGMETDHGLRGGCVLGMSR